MQLGGSEGKESACNVGDPGLIPESGFDSWSRKWQPIPVFLLGKVHGQYSPWGHKEIVTTEASEHALTHCSARCGQLTQLCPEIVSVREV